MQINVAVVQTYTEKYILSLFIAISMQLKEHTSKLFQHSLYYGLTLSSYMLKAQHAWRVAQIAMVMPIMGSCKGIHFLPSGVLE